MALVLARSLDMNIHISWVYLLFAIFSLARHRLEPVSRILIHKKHIRSQRRLATRRLPNNPSFRFSTVPFLFRFRFCSTCDRFVGLCLRSCSCSLLSIGCYVSVCLLVCSFGLPPFSPVCWLLFRSPPSQRSAKQRVFSVLRRRRGRAKTSVRIPYNKKANPRLWASRLRSSSPPFFVFGFCVFPRVILLRRPFCVGDCASVFSF